MVPLYINQHGIIPSNMDAIHPPFEFIYANAAARIADEGFTDTDRYKVALQTDDGSVWVVMSVASGIATWRALNGRGLGPQAFTVASGQTQATFTFPNISQDAVLEFVKTAPVAGVYVDIFTINTNPNPALNEVTVTLNGETPADVTFNAYEKVA